MKLQYHITKPQNVLDSWSSTWAELDVADQITKIENDALQRVLENYVPDVGRMVEAGCGLGRWVIHLHQRGREIVGVDNSINGLEKLKAYEPTAKVVLADVESTPFPDNCFQTYVSIGVIEHFEEGPQEALREAFRILRPGGVALVSVPLLNSVRKAKWPFWLMKQVWHGLCFWRSSPHFFEYHYSTGQLCQFLRAAGFDMVDLVPMHPSFGLMFDFPFLRARGSTQMQWEISSLGRFLARGLHRISPWTISHMVLAVATVQGANSA